MKNCILIGRGSLIISCIEILKKKSLSILGIITTDIEILELLATYDLPIYDNVGQIVALAEKIDYLFSIDNPVILKQSELAYFSCPINFHNSLLPLYAGSHATTWAILQGEKNYGVTWHLMSEEIDAGDILLQQEVIISPDDSAFKLNIKCFAAAIESFSILCSRLMGSALLSRPQNLNIRTFYPLNKKPKANGLLHSNMKISDVFNLIRALDYGPYDNPLALPKLILGNNLIAIGKVQNTFDKEECSLENKSAGINLILKDGVVCVSELKLLMENKKPQIESLDFFLGKTYSINIEEQRDLEFWNDKVGDYENIFIKDFHEYTPDTGLHKIYLSPLKQGIDSKVAIFTLDVNTEDLQKLLYCFSVTAENFFLALLTVYLLKLDNAQMVHYGLQITESKTACFSSINPCTINLNNAMKFREVLSVCELKITERSQVWPCDLYERYASLSRYRNQSLSEIFPVVISLSDSFQVNNLTESFIFKIKKNEIELCIPLDLLDMQVWSTHDKNLAADKLADWIKSQLNSLLSQIVRSPEVQLDNLSILPEAYKKVVFNQWNYTKQVFAGEKRMHLQFISQAKITPNNIAVIAPQKMMTYQELLLSVCHYAALLCSQGVVKGSCVGIYMEKGYEQVIACLAVLLAGASYVPLNKEDPIGRIKRFIIRAEIKFLLTNIDSGDKISNLDIAFSVVSWPLHSKELLDFPFDLSIVPNHNIAYIIFTSGTTGEPKGIVTTHESVLNTIYDINQRLNLNEKDRTLLLSALSFDLSVYDIFAPLFVGGAIVIPHKDHHRDPRALITYLQNHQVSIWNSVPAYVDLLISFLEDKQLSLNNIKLRAILMSGDWIPIDLPKRVVDKIASVTDVWSLGGATEGAIWSIYFPIDSQQDYLKSIPYGYPLSNQKMFVYDKNLLPTSVGITGDIYIGGKGVALGYCKDNDLTEKHFITHPLTNEKLYRTGDIGKYRDDGCILFQGRKDSQIKISGFRVELKEIEYLLIDHPLVNLAVAIVHAVDMNKNIYLAVSPRLSQAELKEISRYLSDHLPYYMIPQSIISLAKIPVTTNGKIDYKKIIKKIAQVNKTNHNPRNAVHSMQTGVLLTIQRAWQEVLKIPVNFNDNFLAIDGRSLAAVRILNKLEKQLESSLELIDFYQYPTPEEFYKFIISSPKITIRQNTELVKVDFLQPLTGNQKRLWFLWKANRKNPFYNMPFLFDISGEINILKLKSALEILVMRQDTLASIVTVQSEKQFWQIKRLQQNKILNVHHIKKNINAREAALTLIKNLASKPFDLEKGPLFNADIVKFGHEKYYFLINFHHIIFDAWSLSIFLTELTQLYNGIQTNQHENQISLPYSLHLTYCEWQNFQVDNKDRMVNDLKYWKKIIGARLPKFNFPVDYIHPEVEKFTGRNHYFSFEHILTDELRNYARLHKLSLYSILLAAFSFLAHKMTLQKDIVLGTSVANRSELLFEKTIGFMANTILLRINLDDDQNFNALADNVQTQVIESLAHQTFSFDKLIEMINPARTLSHNPLFQVAFVLLNMDSPTLNFNGVKVEKSYLDINISRFDIIFYVYDNNLNCLEGYVEYNTDLFDSKSISHLSQCYEEITRMALLQNYMPLKKVDLSRFSNQDLYPLPVKKLQLAQYRAKTVIEQFCQWAISYPDSIALQTIEQNMTYGELYQRAYSLANYLYAQRAIHKQFIVLYFHRSFDMIVAILAVLMSGNAYVPIHLSWPQNRIKQIIENCNCHYILSSQPLVLKMSFPPEIIYLDNNNPSSFADITLANLPVVELQDAAYIIYTSGTTGVPKGVLINHLNLARLFAMTSSRVAYGESDIWLQFHSYAFDFSVWEIFGALAHGGSLVLAPDEISSSPKIFAEFINEYSITIVSQTPGAFYSLMDSINLIENLSFNKLRYIVFGGEKLDASKLARWNNHFGLEKPILINMYGITEVTVHVTSHVITELDIVRTESHIGEPFDDMQAYILDENLIQLPKGMMGELYLAGPGLAQGYLNDKELTMKKFITVKLPGKDECILYKTGDLAKFSIDAGIIFCSRLDRQIKVRGYRVELDEVEAALKKLPFVSSAVVIADEGLGKVMQLHAFLKVDKLYSGIEMMTKIQQRSWSQIFDEIYQNSSSLYPKGFNIAGWRNSLTHEIFSDFEMQEWLENILNLIRGLKPSSVLEIGYGSGLILLNIYKYCEKYVATDISIVAESVVEAQVTDAEKENFQRIVRRYRLDANQLSELADKNYDTVIVNSVIQYFPSGQYLGQFIDYLMCEIKPNTIVLGDIRNYMHNALYWRLVAAYQLHYRAAQCDFEKLVMHYASHENELLLDPQYFYKITDKYSQAYKVNIFIKSGTVANELNLFRYDVVLLKDDANLFTIDVCFVDWDSKIWSKEEIRAYLLKENPPYWGLSSVKDVWISQVQLIDQWLSQAEFVGTFNEYLKKYSDDLPGTERNFFTEIAKNSGYQVYFLVSADNNCQTFNVVFIQESVVKKFKRFYIKQSLKSPLLNNDMLFNAPFARFLDTGQIRIALQNYIPEYALPHTFHVINSWPLNSSDKIDKDQLLALVKFPKALRHLYKPPVSDKEKLIAEIWEEYLGIQNIGIYDNFFELGGDSISSIMIVSKLNKKCLNIKTKDIFKYQTIHELAQQVSFELPAYLETACSEILIPLSSTQTWFFQKNITNFNQWLYGFTVSLAWRINDDILRKCIKLVVDAHDTFKLRYKQTVDGWEQYYQRCNDNYYFSVLVGEKDLYNASDIAGFINAKIKRIDITFGPLIEFFLLRMPSRDVLIVLSHHLIIDGISMRLLLEDLNSAYFDVVKNLFVKNLSVSTSSHKWFEYCHKIKDNCVSDHLLLWAEQEQCGLHKKFPEFIGGKYAFDYLELRDKISWQDFKSLNNPAAYKIILTVVAKAILQIFSIDHFIVDLEDQIRNISEDNFSRTIGWLVAVYPMMIHGESNNLLGFHEKISARFSELHNKAHTFGVIKYLSNDVDAKKLIKPLDNARVLFNFHGNITLNSNGPFQFEHILSEGLHDPNYISPYLIEVNTFLLHNELHFGMRYHSQYIQPENILEFMQRIKDYLKILRPDKIIALNPLRYFEQEL